MEQQQQKANKDGDDKLLQHFIDVTTDTLKTKLAPSTTEIWKNKITDFIEARMLNWWDFGQNKADCMQEIDSLQDLLPLFTNPDGELPTMLKTSISALTQLAHEFGELDKDAPAVISELASIRARMQERMTIIRDRLKWSNINDKDAFKRDTDHFVDELKQLRKGAEKLLQEPVNHGLWQRIRIVMKEWMVDQAKLLQNWDELEFVVGRDFGYMIVNKNENADFADMKLAQTENPLFADSSKIEQLQKMAGELQSNIDRHHDKIKELQKRLDDNNNATKKEEGKQGEEGDEKDGKKITIRKYTIHVRPRDAGDQQKNKKAEKVKDKKEEEGEKKEEKEEIRAFKKDYEQQMQCHGTAAFLQRLETDLEMEILQNKHALMLDDDSRNSEDPDDRWLDDEIRKELEAETAWKTKMLEYLHDYSTRETQNKEQENKEQEKEQEQEQDKKQEQLFDSVMKSLFNGLPKSGMGDIGTLLPTLLQTLVNQPVEKEHCEEKKAEVEKDSASSSPKFLPGGLLNAVLPFLESITNKGDSCPVSALLNSVTGQGFKLSDLWPILMKTAIIVRLVLEPMFTVHGDWMESQGWIDFSLLQQWRHFEQTRIKSKTKENQF